MKKHLIYLLTAALIVALSACESGQSDKHAKADGDYDRTVLPVKLPKPPTYSELDVRNATPPPHVEVKAPEGAPNVLLVLIDDLGFAGTSKFGGPVSTPTFDRIASEGLYYNNFHTTAVCSPTRAALKSGRNHHQKHHSQFHKSHNIRTM